MRFMRLMMKYTRMDYKGKDTLQELKTEAVMDRIRKYTNNWIQHDNAKGQFPQNSKMLQTLGTKEPRTTLKRLLEH
jgi:hypothetical protein